jgi:hypothetical protein
MDPFKDYNFSSPESGFYSDTSSTQFRRDSLSPSFSFQDGSSLESISFGTGMLIIF